MGGVGLDLGEKRSETYLIEYYSCLDCCVENSSEARSWTKQKKMAYRCQVFAYPRLDDSSSSLPALTANSKTTWKLTLCAYSLTMMMMMISQVPFIEYLLCGRNL